MRPVSAHVAFVPVLGLLVFQAGCQSGAPTASVLSLFGLSERPLVIALVVEPGVLNPFAPYESLRKSMSESIKRPVRLDLCLPVQLEPNLNLGFYDLAFVSPACYAEMRDPERFEIVAVPVDESGREGRGAALVVASAGNIQAVADLRAKKVAFGPRGDARTHHAGLALLREHGLKKTDLSLSLFPIPGSLPHYANMQQIAVSVIEGNSDAGFIDEDALAELESASDETGVARDKIRVIARTMALPEKLLIRSPKVKPETVRKVTEFLFNADRKHPEALRPLLARAYREPTETMRASCARLTEVRGSPASSPASEAADKPVP